MPSQTARARETRKPDNGISVTTISQPDSAARHRACLFECDPADRLHCEALDVDGEVIGEAGPLDN